MLMKKFKMDYQLKTAHNYVLKRYYDYRSIISNNC